MGSGRGKTKRVATESSSEKKWLSLEDCENRGVYRIHSRNLLVGVFDGSEGFIGIREKFGDKFLFKEYHWEASPTLGTVRPMEKIADLPVEIEVEEGDSLCQNCKVPTGFEKGVEGGPGIWSHLAETTCKDPRSGFYRYEPLFSYLTELEKEEES